MKVLTVNSSDLDGGAARAAYRLHQGLLRIGLDSRMLVQSRTSDDHRVQGPVTAMDKAMARIRPSLDLYPVKRYPNYGRKMFSPAWLPFGGLVDRINASDADVVHLHWITAGMFRLEELERINKPMVWSLHDMWAYTGGCHYDEECGRWRTSCGSCPVLGSSKETDLSRKVFQRKLKTYARLKGRLTIVGLSAWMAECAQDSTLMKDLRVVQLPNPIDTAVFKPVDRRVAREILGLPTDKPVVLFGAVNATADPRKGFVHLSEALRSLPHRSMELAVFGASRPQQVPDLGHPIHYLGRLHDDAALCLLYNAADVTVVPSLQENLSNTIVESLACGTPVVAFGIGGNKDMVEHGVNGALAPAFDARALADGIRWVLDSGRSDEVRSNARRIALERFELVQVSERYRALYREVIG
jgi:glycosyltransferase involved in cell wall biosynthesis